jgi:hypothetical protein
MTKHARVADRDDRIGAISEVPGALNIACAPAK